MYNNLHAHWHHHENVDTKERGVENDKFISFTFLSTWCQYFNGGVCTPSSSQVLFTDKWPSGGEWEGERTKCWEQK